MAARVIQLGSREMTFPSADLCQIESSADLLELGDGGVALRARFERDGFVYLRGALGSAAVGFALAHVRENLTERGTVLGADGLLLPECGVGCVPNYEGVNGTTHAPPVAAVLEGEPLRRAVGLLLNEAPEKLRTYDYKWLRAMPRKAFTGVHVDSVYMSRGTRQLITAWIPFDAHATLELGALAVLKGSHNAASLDKLHATYGRLDTENETGFQGSGWLTTDPLDPAVVNKDVVWVTGDYAAGDVILFGLNTAHCSTANLTDAARVSADVRWQRASEPIDDRYIGSLEEMKEKASSRKKGGANFIADSANMGSVVTIDDLRKRWDL